MTYLVFLAILLLLVAYILGCFLGAWWRRRQPDMRGAEDGAPPVKAGSGSEATTSSPRVASGGDSFGGVRAATAVSSSDSPAPNDPSSIEDASTTVAAKTTREDTRADSEPETGPPPVTAASGLPLSEADAESAKKADVAGSRPAGLVSPRAGQADQLTRVKGIGPVNEKRLHSLGIYHFDQIAAWGADEIAWVDTFLTFKGRIEREDWVGQAATLAKDD